jgi:hypothetical protein
MAALLEIKYFNTFILKKILDNGENHRVNCPEPLAEPPQPAWATWNGSFGIPELLGGFNMGYGDPTNIHSWVIEEARITGGYNNTTVDFGVRAYAVDEDTYATIKFNSLIYSGIFNSRTGINNTNQFSVGEEITRSVQPSDGSIQKLHAEDTNLIIFQEEKVSRALIDKDAIYSAEGGGLITSSNAVIGQVQAYSGNYGISKDPGSFAVYGYRKYFTDKNKNAVLRLSQDGITELSEYGMVDYFRDEFNNIDSTGYPGKIVGGWDIYNKEYVISLQTNSASETQTYSTLTFDENILGFTSFFDYKPSQAISINNKFYTLNNGSLWLHYSPKASRNKFYYNDIVSSTITFVFNEQPSLIKNFKTVNYEGTNGWQANSFVSDFTGPDNFNSTVVNYQDTTNSVYSYTEGAYDNYGNEYPGLPNALIPPLNYAGFMRQENKYKANLISDSLPQEAEISFGDSVTGIKGFYAVVTLSTDAFTDPGGYKELFAVSTEFINSSY